MHIFIYIFHPQKSGSLFILFFDLVRRYSVDLQPDIKRKHYILCKVYNNKTYN